MTSQYVFAEDKTSKKGNGVNAVLKFMSDTIAFNDKLKACIEAQDDPQAKLELAKYTAMIEDLYSTLSTAASDGIRSFKDEKVEHGETIKDEVAKKPAASEPVMVNAPIVPKLP